MTHPSDAPEGVTPPAVNPAPTPYADVNRVLAELVARAQAVLGDNFVGAYLQGSFALGDFDHGSDIDFLIVLLDDVGPADIARLQAMHAELHDLVPPWSQRLEGSYVPAAVLLRLTDEPRDPPGEPRPDDWRDPGTGGSPPRVYPLVYKDNGATVLVRSEHDNSLVVRWTAREGGVPLAGPPIRTLIDPVPAEALKAEVRATLIRVLAMWLDDGLPIEASHTQSFLVTFSCRVLHTLACGRVTSKKAASAWAAGALDPRWRSLIEAALAEKLQPLEARLAPADPGAVAETLAFLAYVRGLGAEPPAAARAKALLALKQAQRPRGPQGAPGWRDNPRGPGGLDHGGRGPAPIRPGGRGRRG